LATTRMLFEGLERRLLLDTVTQTFHVEYNQPPGGGGPRPSPPQAPEQPPPLDRPGQPRPDLIGLVRHATGQSLEVQTREGLRSVSLNGQTRIVRRVDEQEERAQWSDLGRGVPVAVFGQFDDAGRTLTAHLIVIRPPQLP